MRSFRNWQIHELALLFFFFLEHTQTLSVLFLCFLTYYLHNVASLQFFFLFFFFCSNFSVLSSSFMPWPLVPISLCFLVQIPEEVIESAYLVSLRCQPLYRQLIFCWLLTSAVWLRPRSRLHHKVYSFGCEVWGGMGRAVSQKICVARASTRTSVGWW